MKTEFYDQHKWLEMHQQADQLIATKDGNVIAAVYKSPNERTREDQDSYIQMLKDWAATLT
jgi:hypothetical protein